MKKIFYTLSLCLLFAGAAQADGNAFTPLNFNDTAYGNKPVATSYSAQAINAIAESEAIGNGNIQNAISQLENAQIDIRNDLLNCKTKYADVDAQFKLIKAERAALKKQVKTVEKRIKEIDRAKERIRKNML
ncbi:MAG: hypothetical protein E7Z89_06930 [Cyanobacteria bacterium SIG28]|nr:hypothetical protein [Cyanobacteria bacterium SIG28]